MISRRPARRSPSWMTDYVGKSSAAAPQSQTQARGDADNKNIWISVENGDI